MNITKNMRKNNKKQVRYQVELTEEQLRLISNCVMDCHRFAAGQTELSNTCLNAGYKREVRDELRKLEHLLPGYDWAGNGCKDERQKKFIAGTYYLYREILHVLAVDNNKDNVYTSETLRCTDSGEPIKIRRIEE